MPSRLAVSTRMPASLRSPRAPQSHRSLGHLRPTRSPALPSGFALPGSRLSARLMPTTSDRPDQSAGCSGRPSEKVRLSPRRLCQLRPSRPRPALCCSATSSVGSGRGAMPGPPPLPEGLPRKRRISSVLLESISGSTSTVKPGKPGATASQMASAGHWRGVMRGEVMAAPWTGCGARSFSVLFLAGFVFGLFLVFFLGLFIGLLFSFLPGFPVGLAVLVLGR